MWTHVCDPLDSRHRAGRDIVACREAARLRIVSDDLVFQAHLTAPHCNQYSVLLGVFRYPDRSLLSASFLFCCIFRQFRVGNPIRKSGRSRPSTASSVHHHPDAASSGPHGWPLGIQVAPLVEETGRRHALFRFARRPSVLPDLPRCKLTSGEQVEVGKLNSTRFRTSSTSMATARHLVRVRGCTPAPCRYRDGNGRGGRCWCWASAPQ
jgi:hypothetical protein